MAGPIRQLWTTSPMMRGDDVIMVQKRLRELGFRIDVDGLYGRGTSGAVREFQGNAGLAADGVVGVATWGRLFPTAGGSAVALPDLGVNSILQSLDELQRLHGKYLDGCEWQLTKDGLRVQNRDGTNPGTDPSPQERALAARVLQDFMQPLATVLSRPKSNVPIELIIAMICTESSGNPLARRREPGCDLNDPERTPNRISLGLMQTLLSTARSALGQPDLPLEALTAPDKSIEAGACYIFMQARQTGFDPPLVAAAYNAGGLYFQGSPANRWRLRQFPIGTPNHVDRFTRYFNAAFAAVNVDALPPTVPSLKRLLNAPAGASPAAGSAPVAGPAPTVADTAGPAPEAAAPATGPGPYVASDPKRLLGQVVGNGQCVAYVRAAADAPHTSLWRRGVLVKGEPSIAPGTAIATFEPDGTYGNKTDLTSHAAIYLGQDAEALVVCDQWVDQPVHERRIRFGGGKPVNDGNQFHVIA